MQNIPHVFNALCIWCVPIFLCQNCFSYLFVRCWYMNGEEWMNVVFFFFFFILLVLVVVIVDWDSLPVFSIRHTTQIYLCSAMHTHSFWTHELYTPPNWVSIYAMLHVFRYKNVFFFYCCTVLFILLFCLTEYCILVERCCCCYFIYFFSAASFCSLFIYVLLLIYFD